MTQYFSTFIPGLGEIVQGQLERALKDLIVDLLLDGLIVYQTNSKPEEIKNLRFLNNSFVAIKDLSDKVSLPTGKVKTFRVVISKENELIHVPKSKLEKLEKIVSVTHKLKPDRANPDIEFWSLTRREGQTLWGIRITKHPDYKTVLQKGQLRPELAYLICLVSEPDKNDVVLDPFSGSGAIPQERKLFPHTKIIFGDIRGTENQKMDALNLHQIPSGSISKIITDPPWGISVGTDLDLNDFYTKAIREFARVLKTGGLLVILIGKKELFKEVLVKASDKFTLLKRFDILVSGKKAAIYKIRRESWKGPIVWSNFCSPSFNSSPFPRFMPPIIR